MNDNTLMGPWVRRFLLEHLVSERNLSRNTQASYRDTLTLLLPFASEGSGCAIDRMTVEDLTPAIVRKFLDHVECVRGCSGVTRNHRLATVHSLAKFIGMRSPLHIAWAGEIRAIPFKKTAKNLISYLEQAEMDALLKAPDRRTRLGDRDHAVLLFLYNSGARADEAAGLLIGNLHLKGSPAVRIIGKGNKWRLCPLWPTTVTALSRLVTGRSETGPVFLGRRNERMTRFGVHRLVTRYAKLASKSMPSLSAKRVSPHSIRHTTAVHLLRSGVDINTIRAWLGHVSLDTTHVYAEVDLEMKATALASVDIKGLPQTAPPRSQLPSLMAFLKGL
jgi:site-specific recombinase XerD